MRKVLVRIGIAISIVVVGALGWAAYLTRDPEPYFRERHGAIETIEAGAPVVERATSRQDVRIVSTSGLAVEMAIRRPAGGDATRRSLFLLLGGHVTGREAIDLVQDTKGAVIAALSYPYSGDHRVKGWRVLAVVPEIRRALRDMPPAILLALDYLLAQSYVDPSRVELVGVSLGAPLACIAGALDPRFTRVWSVHGAGDLFAVLDHNLKRKIDWQPARAAVAGLAYIAAGGSGLAPERWVARIVPRPFVMINAEDDERLPRACIERLFEVAREPREIVWRPGRHVEPKREEIVHDLIDLVLDRPR